MTKFGKFGKFFTVKPKIRKSLLGILLENLGKIVNFFDNFEKIYDLILSNDFLEKLTIFSVFYTVYMVKKIIFQ